MAFPAPKQQQQHPLPTMCGATSAPPPTPSNQHFGTSSDASDILSRLFHRLPPTLSLPTRRATTSTTTSATTAATPLPILSLSSDETDSDDDIILSAASQLGIFQLTDHGIRPELARAAESEASSLFDLSLEQKESLFPGDWPLGYEGVDEDDGDEGTESFCLDSASHRADLTSLHEFRRKMEKIGLKIVGGVYKALGFDNPVEDPSRVCSLLWISLNGPAGPKPAVSGGHYPFVLGLDYQIRNQRYTVVTDSLTDSGLETVSVSPQLDSVIVTTGDIAQVWSNGKLKKVRGKPTACSTEGNDTFITMSLLLTLPLDSTVSPLLVRTKTDKDHEEVEVTDEPGITEISNKGKQEEEQVMFNPFSFEDYAWRVYHERLPMKDPLDRYRT